MAHEFVRPGEETQKYELDFWPVDQFLIKKKEEKKGQVSDLRPKGKDEGVERRRKRKKQSNYMLRNQFLSNFFPPSSLTNFSFLLFHLFYSSLLSF